MNLRDATIASLAQYILRHGTDANEDVQRRLARKRAQIIALQSGLNPTTGKPESEAEFAARHERIASGIIFPPPGKGPLPELDDSDRTRLFLAQAALTLSATHSDAALAELVRTAASLNLSAGEKDHLRSRGLAV